MLFHSRLHLTWSRSWHFSVQTQRFPQVDSFCWRNLVKSIHNVVDCWSLLRVYFQRAHWTHVRHRHVKDGVWRQRHRSTTSTSIMDCSDDSFKSNLKIFLFVKQQISHVFPSCTAVSLHKQLLFISQVCVGSHVECTCACRCLWECVHAFRMALSDKVQCITNTLIIIIIIVVMMIPHPPKQQAWTH